MQKNRTWVVLAAALAALLSLVPSCGKDAAQQAAPSGCGSDNDCKGNRICEAGQCVDPRGAPEAARPHPPVPPIPPGLGAPPAPPEGMPPPAPPLPGAAEPAPRPAQPQAAEPSRLEAAPRLGATVPMVIVTEFGDFQCQYCAHSTTVIRSVLEKYGKPDGEVAFEWRHDPLDVHPMAETLARAALAAHLQGRFWQLHDQLFANQKQIDDASLERYAQLAGLDLVRWAEDRKSEPVVEAVARDRRVAQALGATGTPTFFVNGRVLGGARKLEAFEELIQDEITKARAKRDAGTPPERIAAALQRENNPDYARYVLDGEAPPAPKRRSVPVDETVWQVLVGPDDPSRGPAEALVTMVELCDFECPFCARYRMTLEALLKAFPAEVRLVFKQSPLAFHKQAKLAAQASLAANAQGKFWAYHDLLFSRQDKLAREDLLQYATELSLDLGKFTQELDSGAYAARVEADQDAAARVEAIGTPNIFVNGRKVVGARELDELVALVQEELAKARKLVEEGVPAKALYEKIVGEGKRKEPLAGGRQDFEAADSPASGPEDAPIRLVVFADFQCPFSSRLVPILDRVGKDFDGKVHTTFKHFPQSFHADAQHAAEAAVCALDQGRFWDLHRQMFDLQNQKALTPADVRGYAKAAGMSTKKLDECLKSDRPAKVITRDLAEAQKAEVKGTPTVFINGRRFASPTGYNDRSFARVFSQILGAGQEKE